MFETKPEGRRKNGEAVEDGENDLREMYLNR
jgi:hypothetical protein